VTRIILGPLLRYVGEREATVWVETDVAGEVRVDAGEVSGSARTFCVAGHHYALVILRGLEPATTVSYTVSCDDVPAWPPRRRSRGTVIRSRGASSTTRSTRWPCG
jgi:hypothetical protein